uniref:Ig-like domain-containing protein n=1 Tax=Amphimedon queenslandica TaxID=400682 RepID=A0A1X7U009_AMPQE
MKDCSLLLLTVILVLQGARGVLMEVCNGVTNINELVSQYSLEVSTSFSSDGSSLSLNCTINNGAANLQPGQELVWTEGGIEIQEGTIRYSVHQSTTSSLLTVNITHGLHYGEYDCQCHNRHNYTHNSLSKLIASGSFTQHCSDKYSITAAPQTSPAPIITTHNVSSPGQTVSITCNQSLAVLVKEHSNGSLIETINNITVSSPNDQGKFGCILNDTILEIHYVTIEGYEPIWFIFPPLLQTTVLPFSVGINPPTLCAVYSPLPLEAFQILFKAGNTCVGNFRSIYSTSGPLGKDLWRINIVPYKGNDVIVKSLDLYCRARTVWETVTSERYKVDFETEGSDLIPSVCVTTSLTPASPALEGSTVTITCHIQYDISVDINVSILRNTNEVLTSSSLQGHNHSYVIKSVKEKDEGNYTCKVTVIATTLSDSIDLQVIPAQTSSSSSRSQTLSLTPSPSPFISIDNTPVPTPTDNVEATLSSNAVTVAAVASVLSSLALLLFLALSLSFGCIVRKGCKENDTEESRARASSRDMQNNHYILS